MAGFRRRIVSAFRGRTVTRQPLRHYAFPHGLVKRPPFVGGTEARHFRLVNAEQSAELADLA